MPKDLERIGYKDLQGLSPEGRDCEACGKPTKDHSWAYMDPNGFIVYCNFKPGEGTPVAAVAPHLHIYSTIDGVLTKTRREVRLGEAIQDYCMANMVTRAEFTFNKPIHPDLEAPSAALHGLIHKFVPGDVGTGYAAKVPFSVTFVGCFCEGKFDTANPPF